MRYFVFILIFPMTMYAQQESRTLIAPNTAWIVQDGDTTGLAIPDTLYRGYPCGVLFRDTLNRVTWVRPCDGTSNMAIAFPDSIMVDSETGLKRTQAQWLLQAQGCLKYEVRLRTQRHTGPYYQKLDTLIIKDTCAGGPGSGITQVTIRDKYGAMAIDTGFVLRDSGAVKIYVQQSAVGLADPRDTVIFEHYERFSFTWSHPLADTGTIGEQQNATIAIQQMCITGVGGYDGFTCWYPVTDTLYAERVGISVGKRINPPQSIMWTDTAYYIDTGILPIPMVGATGKFPADIGLFFVPANALPASVRKVKSVELRKLPTGTSTGLSSFASYNASTSLAQSGTDWAIWALPQGYQLKTEDQINVTIRFRYKIKP